MVVMTKKELYHQFATSTAEEFAFRWLPFTALGLGNWLWVFVLAVAFGAGHWFTYKDWLRTLLVLVFGGLVLNYLYVFVIPAPWNFIAVILIHFAARLVGKKWL